MTAPPDSTHDLPALAPRLALGEEEAFAAVVHQCKPLVFRWAVALCGDADQAEDVTQEVFIRVHRKAATFRGDGAFEGWLYRITRRVVQRSHWKASRRPPADAASSDVYVTDPGARVDRERAVEMIRAIAGELPMRQREVFVLCDLEGRTPSEVARMIGVKEVSVRASLFKARASIRRTILTTHPRYREHQA